MKHLKIALLALVGAFTYQANAQESSFIVKAGVNINSITTDDVTKPKSDIGFHFGASYEMPIASIVSIEPGVYFDTRGSKLTIFEAGDAKIVAKHSLMGVNIPVLAKVRVEIGTAAVFFNAGPYAYIPFSGKNTLKASGGADTKNINLAEVKFGDKVGEYKRFNFGLNFGAGVEVSNFVLGFGYDLGLNDSQKGLLKDHINSKYNALKISVGYKF